MKKLLLTALSAILFFGCAEERNNILKVYNWADYIDEELIGEFEQWYEEQTGEKVEIIYQTSTSMRRCSQRSNWATKTTT